MWWGVLWCRWSWFVGNNYQFLFKRLVAIIIIHDFGVSRMRQWSLLSSSLCCSRVARLFLWKQLVGSSFPPPPLWSFSQSRETITNQIAISYIFAGNHIYVSIVRTPPMALFKNTPSFPVIILIHQNWILQFLRRRLGWLTDLYQQVWIIVERKINQLQLLDRRQR